MEIGLGGDVCSHDSGMSVMDLEVALRDLAAALATAKTERRRDARWREGRRVLIHWCAEAMRIELAEVLSIAEVIKVAAEHPSRHARRACATLVLHALAAPGLIPLGSDADVCTLAEGALRDVLLRCGYPFGGSVEERMHVLERLPASIAELSQPFEPTFPNWQGLYAG
jgi:hypothetical protein